MPVLIRVAALSSLVLSLILALILSGPVSAAEIRVAVASNFLIPIKAIAKTYHEQTGDKLIISAGSTGKLYAQIVNGAPFDVFLAANSREPKRLEQEGHARSGSRFTYARGRLALWYPKAKSSQYPKGDAEAETNTKSYESLLRSNEYKRLSMANPLTAPYGAAAVSVLKNLKLDQGTHRKFLRGENISQAYQFVATGAVDLGFVALSQLKAAPGKPKGMYWVVEENLHEPILQQAVLLKSARQAVKAQGFLDYLQSKEGKAMIESFGYGLL